MYLIYCTKVIIIFQPHPKHADVFIPSCYVVVAPMTMAHLRTAPTKQAGLQFGVLSNTWEVTGSTTMNKWQWPIMNGCKCNSQFLAQWNLQLTPRWDACINVL